jgi:hypothetical protein
VGGRQIDKEVEGSGRKGKGDVSFVFMTLRHQLTTEDMGKATTCMLASLITSRVAPVLV